MDHRKNQSLAFASPARLPFSGLGFDLAPVVARAKRLSIRIERVERDIPVFHRAPDTAFGYGLMLMQGREIRAR